MANAINTQDRNYSQAEKKFINEHGELGQALLDRYELKDAKEAMADNYYGEYYTREDFAKSYMQDRADEMLPSESFEHHILSNWCNWEHVAWELFVNDFTGIEIGNTIHVFRAF